MKPIQFTPDLLDDFDRGRVAVFLGAGVSAGVKTRSGQPIRTWPIFLEETANRIADKKKNKEIKELIAHGDYLFACEILKENIGDSWEETLKDEYEKIGDPSELQQAILKLNPRIIVTTNFDLFIETQWEKVNTAATHHLQVKNGISADCFSAFRDDKPYLIKLHGSINNPESMIFSLSDYAEKAHSNWQYSTFMDTLLCTHTVIFIGFSMKDTAITNLLEIYAKRYPKSRPHYAFMPDLQSADKIKIMKQHRRLFILPYTSKNNHAQLTSLIEQLNSEISERKRLNSTPQTSNNPQNPAHQ